MNYDNPYALQNVDAVANAAVNERSEFIRRTYLHLAAAVMAFIVLEGVLLALFPPAQLLQAMQGMLGGMGWLVILGGFMVVGWVARKWADSDTSPAMQYAGLGLYVVAQALIFMPLMAISLLLDPSGLIPFQAGVITAVVFGGLTAMVFLTGADFSWMGRYLFLGGLVAMGLIVVGMITGGFSLGLLFSGFLVLLAAGYILYDTSNVMHHYRPTQHVAASLALFASVALMLWYVMQILIALQRD